MRVDDAVALLEVVGAWSPPGSMPAQFEIVIQTRKRRVAVAALPAPSNLGPAGRMWRAAFAASEDDVSGPDALFTLRVERDMIALPTPERVNLQSGGPLAVLTRGAEADDAFAADADADSDDQPAGELASRAPAESEAVGHRHELAEARATIDAYRRLTTWLRSRVVRNVDEIGALERTVRSLIESLQQEREREADERQAAADRQMSQLSETATSIETALAAHASEVGALTERMAAAAQSVDVARPAPQAAPPAALTTAAVRARVEELREVEESIRRLRDELRGGARTAAQNDEDPEARARRESEIMRQALAASAQRDRAS